MGSYMQCLGFLNFAPLSRAATSLSRRFFAQRRKSILRELRKQNISACMGRFGKVVRLTCPELLPLYCFVSCPSRPAVAIDLAKVDSSCRTHGRPQVELRVPWHVPGDSEFREVPDAMLLSIQVVQPIYPYSLQVYIYIYIYVCIVLNLGLNVHKYQR